MSTTIRPMTPDDIPILARWMVQTPLWQRYGMAAAQAEADLLVGLAQNDICLVADVGTDRACGFAWCVPRGAFGRSAYLRLIGVRPERTGSGIGAELLAAVEAQAALISVDLFLLVSDFNAGAQRFYQRNGFIQVGAIPGYVMPDITELMFRKRL